jgi:hypothetical protein
VKVLIIDPSQRSMKEEALIRRTASDNEKWYTGEMEYGLKGNCNRSWRRSEREIKKLGGPRYSLCSSGFAASGDGELWCSS